MASDTDVAFYFAHFLTDLAGAEPTPFRGAEKFAAKFPPKVNVSSLVHRGVNNKTSEVLTQSCVHNPLRRLQRLDGSA